jgi:hypothetical protein
MAWPTFSSLFVMCALGSALAVQNSVLATGQQMRTDAARDFELEVVLESLNERGNRISSTATTRWWFVAALPSFGTWRHCQRELEGCRRMSDMYGPSLQCTVRLIGV